MDIPYWSVGHRRPLDTRSVLWWRGTFQRNPIMKCPKSQLRFPESRKPMDTLLHTHTSPHITIDRWSLVFHLLYILQPSCRQYCHGQPVVQHQTSRDSSGREMGVSINGRSPSSLDGGFISWKIYSPVPIPGAHPTSRKRWIPQAAQALSIFQLGAL